MSDLFLDPLEEKIHHSSSLFVEGLWNIILAVPITFGYFEASSVSFEQYFKLHFVLP